MPTEQNVSAAHIEASNSIARVIESTWLATDPAAKAAFEQRCRAYGSTAEDWNRFLGDHAGRLVFGKSASAGARLASINDVHGVLRVRAPLARVREASGAERIVHINESYPVVRAAVPKADGSGNEDRYFVKGPGQAFVKFTDFQRLVEEGDQPLLAEHASAAAQWKAHDTPMRTRMQQLVEGYADDDKLTARRTPSESDQALMGQPPNATPYIDAERWSNLEVSFAGGMGPVLSNLRLMGLIEKNGTEGRVIILLNDDRALQDRPSVLDAVSTVHTPAIQELGGSIVAQIHGVKPHEVMGPATELSGIKGGNVQRAAAGLHEALNAIKARLLGRDAERATQRDIHLRLPTQDGAIHELRFGENGIQMRLAQPQPSFGDSAEVAFGRGQQPDAEFNVYSYRGGYIGRHSEPDGRPDPKVVLSNGEALLAGPLLKQRDGVTGSLLRLGEGLGNLATPNRAFGMSTYLSAIGSVALGAAVKFGWIFLEVAKTNQFKEAMGHRDDAGRPVYVPGATAVSAVGSANVTPATIATVAALVVCSNEIISFALRHVRKSLPGHMLNPEHEVKKLGADWAAGFAEEVVRQSVGMGVQQAFGIDRFNAGAGFIAGYAAIHGAIDALKARSGAPENHPVLFLAMDVMRVMLYEIFRAGSLATQTGQNLLTQFSESVATRASSRLPDKLGTAIGGTVGNELGMYGDNASAYADQMDRETRALNPVAYGKNLLNAITNHGDSLTNRSSIHGAEQKVTQLAELFMVKMKRITDQLPADLQAAQQIELQSLQLQRSGEAMDATEARLLARFDAMVTGVRGHAADGDAAAVPHYDTRGLSQRTVAFERDNRMAHEARVAAGAPRPAHHVRSETPVWKGPGDRSYAATTVKGSGARRADHVERYATTFSPDPQQRAMEITDAMRQFPALNEQLNQALKDLGLSTSQAIALTQEMLNALRIYTRQSQPVHYTDRYAVNQGSKDMTRVGGTASLQVERQILSTADNVSNDASKQVDGTVQMYMSLAAVLMAQRDGLMPAVFRRAVNTLVDYEDRSADFLLDPITSRVLEPGALVHMPETLSVTLDPAGMPPGFGYQVTNFGADVPQRSLMIVGYAPTLLNMAREAELTQAEAIAMPGMAAEVVAIAPMEVSHLTDAERAAGHRPLGEVVYMKAKNTFAELEKPFVDTLAWMQDPAKGSEPADGARMLDASTGTLYRYDKALTRLLKVEPLTPEDNAATRADARPRNYFHGKPANTDVWINPYISSGTMRGMREDLHRLVMSGRWPNAIMERLVQNPHHEFYRRRGHYDGSAYELHATRLHARIDSLHRDLRADLDTFQGPGGLEKPLDLTGGAGRIMSSSTEMLAFLASSVLRRPVHLVPVGRDSVLGEDVRIEHTYDGVNMTDQPLHSHQEPRTSRAILVGVGADGYYAGKWQGDRFVAESRFDGVGDGRSLGNLLHAIARDEFLDNTTLASASLLGGASYARKPPQVGADGLAAAGTLQPNGAAKKGVAGLWADMHKLASVDISYVKHGITAAYTAMKGEPMPEPAAYFEPQWTPQEQGGRRQGPVITITEGQ